MNFTTDLPKKKPYVTYIVASAVKCQKFFPNSKNEGPAFRMHAVILSKKFLLIKIVIVKKTTAKNLIIFYVIFVK